MSRRSFTAIGYKYLVGKSPERNWSDRESRLTTTVVFACLALVSVVVIYFMYPGTKGKSLEELAELFADPIVVHPT
jgi:hypothetical protein